VTLTSAETAPPKTGAIAIKKDRTIADTFGIIRQWR